MFVIFSPITNNIDKFYMRLFVIQISTQFYLVVSCTVHCWQYFVFDDHLFPNFQYQILYGLHGFGLTTKYLYVLRPHVRAGGQRLKIIKEWKHTWSIDKHPRPSSIGLVKLKQYMMKSTPTDPKWTRGWEQWQSSISIFRMAWQDAATSSQDCQATATSLLLKLWPSLWHWTIIGTWAKLGMIWLSIPTPCLLCNHFSLKTQITLAFVTPCTSAGLWTTKAHMFVFCSIPCQCGIEGNERVDQLTKDTLDHDIGTLANVFCADLKPLVNTYMHEFVQTRWDVSGHGKYLYLLKPTLGPPPTRTTTN